MPDRLSALDASFLYLEHPTTPMHVGAVAIFRRPRSGFDYERLRRLIDQRIDMVPRYRQKVRHVPASLARPVWVDDEDFDLGYHVRRSALPKPGTDRALFDLIARLMSRPLDHTRPLWEMYLVEGLARNRIAMVTKTHQALVDGVRAIDIAQVILDVSPDRQPGHGPEWRPRPEPSGLRLVTDAVRDAWNRPTEVVDNVRAAAGDAVATAGKMADVIGQVATVVRTAASRAPVSPLNVAVSTQRRFAVARTRLDDYRAVRTAHGCAVNDVVLAVVAGAMRNWLLARGEPVTSSSTVRAMVPLSVRADPDVATGSGALAGNMGNRVASFLVDLPVGEGNAVVRLHQLSHQLRAHTDSGRSVGAEALVRLGGFAPPTLHALGARAASGISKRIFNVVVTNVPGPQVPLYAAGATMLEMFPVVPLARGQALAIGLTSYDGGVYYGFNADRDAMGDVDLLAGMISESLDELRTGSTG
ncbi:wax ester/triacylglycerol synthase family O-acyltransferase [Pseudonocardia eucalypti]|uniref:Diacylglycerol O-acyltransferase n=1 Tax=Pseudonocardia eucalypti TaxID=648755 RepID=A0ABP9PRL2_9PSEU|nr:WS/DGAT/MGAT family acyltransferase [Pseudonocardia eucalypti]